ncbi:MAG: hypothetical protein ACJ77K_16580 [Bacteroidia bacterium]
MMKKLTALFLSLPFALSVHAQTKNYFPNLKKIAIDTFYKANFWCDAASRVINKPCGLLDKKDPFYCPESSHLKVTWLLNIKTRT